MAGALAALYYTLLAVFAYLTSGAHAHGNILWDAAVESKNVFVIGFRTDAAFAPQPQGFLHVFECTDALLRALSVSVVLIKIVHW